MRSIDSNLYIQRLNTYLRSNEYYNGNTYEDDNKKNSEFESYRHDYWRYVENSENE